MARSTLSTLFIEKLAGQFKAHWQNTLGTKGRCQVGITVPPDWDPQDPVDPVVRCAEALLREGAMPRLIYLGGGQPEEQMHGLDALVVPGDKDVDPKFYGEQSPVNPELDPAFDAFELTCLKLALERDLPFLGSSRGAHIMNVVTGGTLSNVPPSEIVHKAPDGNTLQGRKTPLHEVETAENSRLEQVVGIDPVVNSVHDQAVDELGRGLKVTARAPDDVVEGIERTGHPWQAAYQFHPEIDKRFQGLFTKLVEDVLRRRKPI